MFGIILISIVTLIQGYVFFRIASIPFIKQYIPLKILISTGILLWVVLFAGRVYGHHNTSALAVALEFIGMNWMGILFLIFICMITIDIITLFGFLMPNLSFKFRTFALFLGILFSFT